MTIWPTFLRLLYLLIFQFGFVLVKGQEVSLSNFLLISFDNNIKLHWVIDSGSTCNGIYILRSADSLNFQEIGRIEGVCGSSSSPTRYEFTDSSPISNKTNYYKLRFGYDQYSEISSLYFKDLDGKEYMIRPNPAKENLTISINNPYNKPRRFRLIDFSGQEVLKNENITEQDILLQRNNLKAGIYTFIIEGDNNYKSVGRICFVD